MPSYSPFNLASHIITYRPGIPSASTCNCDTAWWVRTTATSGTKVILAKKAVSEQGYVMYLWNGQPGFQLADGSGHTNYSSARSVADGNWHHVAVTVDRDDPNGLVFYVDGANVRERDPTGRPGSLTNSGDLWVGGNPVSPTGRFDGLIDEVELFNRA
ncbi:MAG: LamG domain-containing protein, partial [Planctomycetota bacterium]